MMKSGLEKKKFVNYSMRKPFLENLFCYIFASNYKFSNENDLLYAWRDFNKTF